jgi:hypothetical protein
MIFARLCGLTACCVLLMLNIPAFAQTAETVLNGNRLAVGAGGASGTLLISYTYKGQGLTGTVQTQIDAQSGAYVTKSNLGIISLGAGFDGQAPWMRDISGANTKQGGGDRVKLAINEAYRNANLWWRRDFGRAHVEYVARETVDGSVLDHLAVTPKDGVRFDAWFDANTHLLARIAERQMFFDTRTIYEGYQKRAGKMVATKLIIDGGTGEANYATMLLKAISRQAVRPLSEYACPQQEPLGVTFPGNRSSVTIEFRLLNNHIYVDALVNGKGPYTFIVDTGGHTILSTRVVSEAGLKVAGETPSAGAGEAISTSGYARVKEIALGPIKMADQTAIVLDIYDPAVEGIRVDGMVGFELIRRLAMQIDYAKSRLTFTRFADFHASSAGKAIPFKFYDHLPQVAGEIGDIPALFNIDTGSRNELDLTGPFVAKNKLYARFPNATTAMTGWGVGGPSMSDVVRLPSLMLGPIAVQSPVAGLSRAKSGSFSDSNYDGNIGSGFLKRFVTSFDYSRQLMYLKPIVPGPPDAGTFDRSGMWMNAGDRGYIVVFVSPGGAADAAGIQKGDIVTAIEGRPAISAQLSDARELLRTTPQGSMVTLETLHNGETRTIKLVLQNRL